MTIRIALDPQELGREYLGIGRWAGDPTDGDTPTIALNIRLVNVDAPEVHYPGTTNPSKHDGILSRLLQTHGGLYPRDLRTYLAPRLKGTPGTDQELWAIEAKKAFKRIADEKLEYDAEKHRYGRKVFLTLGESPFDRFKRLLAYVAPEEKDPQKRLTLNLLMAREGWALNYIIFPNIPKLKDLQLLRDAVQNARTKKWGFWKQANLLLGYEFRNAVDTAKGQARGPRRYCADISTGLLYPPGEYFRILPENRIFIDPEQLERARETLKLRWA